VLFLIAVAVAQWWLSDEMFWRGTRWRVGGQDDVEVEPKKRSE
jgi:hypothetical protein